MLESLCKQISRKVTDAGASADQLHQLEAHRWQLENETTAPFRSENEVRNQHPIDQPAMLAQWEWILAIGCPDAVQGQDWASLAPEMRDEIKALCIDTLIAMVAEWREIPLLDRQETIHNRDA